MGYAVEFHCRPFSPTLTGHQATLVATLHDTRRNLGLPHVKYVSFLHIEKDRESKFLNLKLQLKKWKNKLIGVVFWIKSYLLFYLSPKKSILDVNKSERIMP